MDEGGVCPRKKAGGLCATYYLQQHCFVGVLLGRRKRLANRALKLYSFFEFAFTRSALSHHTRHTKRIMKCRLCDMKYLRYEIRLMPYEIKFVHICVAYFILRRQYFITQLFHLYVGQISL